MRPKDLQEIFELTQREAQLREELLRVVEQQADRIARARVAGRPMGRITKTVAAAIGCCGSIAEYEQLRQRLSQRVSRQRRNGVAPGSAP
jgi:hypothetical protein